MVSNSSYNFILNVIETYPKIAIESCPDGGIMIFVVSNPRAECVLDLE